MKPIIEEKYADDGAHSHWDVIDSETGSVILENIEKKNVFIRKFEYKGLGEVRKRFGGSHPEEKLLFIKNARNDIFTDITTILSSGKYNVEIKITEVQDEDK